MAPERPRPDFDQVREAMRERDVRAEEPEPPPPPPEGDERDEDEREDGSASG